VVSNNILKQRQKIKDAEDKLKHKREHKNSNDAISCEFEEKEQLVAQQFKEQREKENSFFNNTQPEEIETINELEEIKTINEPEEIKTINKPEEIEDVDDSNNPYMGEPKTQYEDEPITDDTKKQKSTLEQERDEKIKNAKNEAEHKILEIKKNLKQNLDTIHVDEMSNYAEEAQSEIEDIETELEETIEEIENDTEEEIDNLDFEEDESYSTNNTNSYSSSFGFSVIPKLAAGLIGMGIIFIVGNILLSQMKTVLISTETNASGTLGGFMLDSSNGMSGLFAIIPIILISFFLLTIFRNNSSNLY